MKILKHTEAKVFCKTVLFTKGILVLKNSFSGQSLPEARYRAVSKTRTAVNGAKRLILK